MASVNRHSAIVTWAKLVLPILGILLLSSLFLFSNNPDPDAAWPYADVDVEEILRDQRVSRPRFAGTMDDGRDVLMIADSATPSTEAQDQLRLDIIEARIELSATDYVILNAESGLFDQDARIADLSGDVRVRTTHGYRLSSERLQVAIGDLWLFSPGAVSASGPGIRIEAGAMELAGQDNRPVLSFTGGVRLLYGAQD